MVTRVARASSRLAERVREHFGELDVAFLNAGVSDWRPFEDHTEESFDRLFDINVKSVFFLTQALITGGDTCEARRHRLPFTHPDVVNVSGIPV
ncbi:SDR family NAD(P)-dependent oxidoreductase [Streptomyces sp. NPDC001714]|uniref:SDR family NAD(P)-dependent oxidoreductase n=1 Tax=Streptomyces sp. NPDC001714 TaxID=3364603 RepID=UPI0036CE3D27